MNDREVRFTITWMRPSDENGSFHYVLEYEAMQRDPYPPFRRHTEDRMTVPPIDGKIQEYTINPAFPFAEYNITLTAVNTKLDRAGGSVTDSRRTIAIGRAL